MTPLHVLLAWLAGIPLALIVIGALEERLELDRTLAMLLGFFWPLALVTGGIGIVAKGLLALGDLLRQVHRLRPVRRVEDDGVLVEGVAYVRVDKAQEIIDTWKAKFKTELTTANTEVEKLRTSLTTMQARLDVAQQHLEGIAPLAQMGRVTLLMIAAEPRPSRLGKELRGLAKVWNVDEEKGIAATNALFEYVRWQGLTKRTPK